MRAGIDEDLACTAGGGRTQTCPVSGPRTVGVYQESRGLVGERAAKASAEVSSHLEATLDPSRLARSTASSPRPTRVTWRRAFLVGGL